MLLVLEMVVLAAVELALGWMSPQTWELLLSEEEEDDDEKCGRCWDWCWRCNKEEEEEEKILLFLSCCEGGEEEEEQLLI